MAYYKSTARKSFEEEIDLIKGAIRAAFTQKGSSAVVRDYILGHAIILASAKIEAYLQDVIETYFQQLNTAGIKTDDLPSVLRVFMFHEGAVANYKKFIVSNDEEKFLQLMTGLIGSNSLLFMVNDTNAPQIMAGKILSQTKYPSPRNLVRLFRRLGIKNILQEINKSSKSDLKAKLQSFHDIRTEIAHIGTLVGKNDKDVKNILAEIKLVVSHIDRVFFRFVCKITPSSCWPK